MPFSLMIIPTLTHSSVPLGSDLCLVSAAMLGLQSLLLPLEWVAPTISILPLKLLEFLECPVPLMAGVVVETSEAQVSLTNSPSPSSIAAASASFSFPPHELIDAGSFGGRGGGRHVPSKARSASLRAAKLLQRCG